MLLMGASKIYDGFCAQLSNKFLLGDNTYPTTVTEVFNMLLNWKYKTVTPHGAVVKNDAGHISFYQKNGSDKEEKKPKKYRIHLIRFRCLQYKDHYENECLYGKY